MRTRRFLVLITAVAALAMAVLMLTGCGGATDVQPPQVLSGSTEPSATRTAPVGEPVRLTVPSVQVDAVVRPIVDDSGEIDPPTEDDAWWWTERGTPGSADTVYLAGHAIHNGDGVFAPLQRVEPGAQIQLDTTAGSRTYRVDATATYDKWNLDRYDEVWQAVPGRLILVTCFVVDGQPTDENYLVYASLVD
ncbi:sortase [Gordonia sp. HNM0687]|uniref:Sortase n=1 Tax=Gordonia mangrovi TaxID=2665643 RepID=A0A6L7GS35_9ACTN|nr:class F sortase [Gordonia mangrovi]MXP21358.1 sortase [Gordonia mangrovi]UVF80108.1 class F sortase [Gordonia mangrovi]